MPVLLVAQKIKQIVVRELMKWQVINTDIGR